MAQEIIDPKERYSRNMQAFSQEELEIIGEKSVAVVGCGGLGGYVCQTLARFGVGKLTVIDGDVFAQSNLNRQVFAAASTLGKNKAEVCKIALKDINEMVEVTAKPCMLTNENADEILANHDLVIDCLDNVSSRFVLAHACEALKLPWVHGAIGGFYGQVANIFPGDGLLGLIYSEECDASTGLEKKLGNPGFTPQLVAALQTCEGLKILANRKEILKGQLLHIDLLYNSFETIDLL